MTVSKQLIDNVNKIKTTLNEISVYNLDVKSSLELYYSLARKVNEVINELSRFEGVVSDEVVEQNKVITNLLNEGLNERVIFKVNELIENGTIQDLINNKIFNELNNKINALKQEVNEQFISIEQTKADISLIGQPTQDQVNDWLNANPQATTTVMDNTITYKKINDQLKQSFEPIFENVELAWAENYWITNGNYYQAQNTFKASKITVQAGDMFRINGYMLGNQRLYLVRDSKDLDRSNGGGGDGLLQYPANGTTSPSWTLVENRVFEIPTGGTYLYVCSPMETLKTSKFKLEKLAYYQPKITEEYLNNVEVFSDLKSENEILKNRIIENQLKNDFAWSEFDKVYVTFTFDDNNTDISDIGSLFESKNKPVCFASIPSKLNNICNNGSKVIDILKRCENNGGEILSHWHTPLTSSSTEEDYYNVYVQSKKLLENEGLTVNGIITSGGTNYNTQDFAKCVDIARLYYEYADRTAESTNLQYIEQFWNPRTFMDGSESKCKTKIDEVALAGKGWIRFASHGAVNNDTIELIGNVIDYAISKGCEIVTWKYMYNKFKSSKLEKRLIALENK